MKNADEPIFPNFMFQMYRVLSEIRASMRRELRENNIAITTEMLQVLIQLWRKEGVNQQELAHLLHKDKASLTYLIDNLTKRGLVIREEDERDRRNKIITLTKKGIELEAVVSPLITRIYAVAGEDISVAFLENGIALFEKIYENLNGSRK